MFHNYEIPTGYFPFISPFFLGPIHGTPQKPHLLSHAPGRDDEGVRSQRVGAGTAQDVHLTDVWDGKKCEK